MSVKPAAVVGIIAILIGIVVGYLVWGSHLQRLADELAAVKGQLAEARQVAQREGAVATRIQEVEGQLKQATESLGKERELREKLEKLTAAKKK